MTASPSLRLSPHDQVSQGKQDANGQSYVLSQLSGESLTIPSTNSVVRLPAGRELTSNCFSVAMTQGAKTEAILPHKHAEAHDTFLCLRGSMQVWAGDQSRILYPGDFASIPPNVIHSYAQCNEAINEFIGIILPAAWENFFRTLGDATEPDCITYPSDDQAPFPGQRIAQAMQEGHDIIPQPQHKLVEATPFTANDCVADQPGQPYFLKADQGPKFLLGDQHLEILCRARNTGNRFSIAWLDGSSCLQQRPLLGAQDALLRFQQAATYLQVIEGTALVTVQRQGGDHASLQKETLWQGEMALIAPNDAFRIDFASPHVRLLVVTGSASSTFQGGLDALFEQHGTPIASKHYFGGGKKGPQAANLSLQQAQQWAQTVDATILSP